MGAAYVEVRTPWSTHSPKRRYLCTDHWRQLTELIDELEYNADNYDMPIDWTSQQFTKAGDANDVSKALQRFKESGFGYQG